MTYVDVTVHAANVFFGPVDTDDEFVDEVRMTGEAVFLQDAGVRALDHDGLMKVLQREALGVMPAVLGFGEILPEETVREVAIDAIGDGMMAGFLPGIILRLHDVTVNADLGIVAHVREPLGVQERVATDAKKDASQDG